MIHRTYISPATRIARACFEKNFAYSPGSPDTNQDNNEKPVDEGNEDF